MEAAEAVRQFFELDGALENTLAPDTSKVAPKPGTAVIDLRQPLDFQDFHLPGSVNVPFIYEDTPNPFSEPQVLESLWRRLEDTFKTPGKELRDIIHSKETLLLCYDGDSARVATSVLRAKGYEADSVKGGFKALRKLREKPDGALRAGNEQQSAEVVKGLSSPIAIPTQVV